ncbi:metallophosphoesterase family protein [Saccharomonospora saliphila]|uniref:metallophosphoesterase family protein n=1 Tax=Saccharomonospora saliphila TaxID=369829 RepID=UPI00036E26B6|nr:metallophosphoesterase [Saccharomonospora saliphila]
MIRVAAVGDVHLGADARGRLRPALEHLPDRADVLVLAGDLTRHGTAEEAAIVAREFGDLGLPVLAVLGNHDHHADAVAEVTRVLRDEGGIRVLEGDGVVLPVNGLRLGVAGVKGFGGGFEGRCASAFGEPEMKAFVGHTLDIADTLRAALAALDCDVRIALTHYAPVPDTLHGEPPEIYPFLGAYQLGEAVDATGTDLALHGHAHLGCEHGVTPGGVRVRNVAQPVIRAAYTVYQLGPDGPPHGDGERQETGAGLTGGGGPRGGEERP